MTSASPPHAPWTPERVVGVEEARALVEACAPTLAPARLEPLGAGFDNTAYLVNGEWVFRFPRRAIAVPWIEREARVLPAVAPELPLPIPVPTHVGSGSESYPWPFSGYRLLPGRTAVAAAPDDDARRRAAPALGAFLRALHAITPARGASLGAGTDELRRLDIPYRRERGRTLLAELVREDALVPDAVVRVERALGQSLPDAPRPPRALVHGDLYALHLIVDDALTLSGVIDWGDVHAGDPAIDLAVAVAFLPDDALASFDAAYGGADEETWRLARFRAAYHSLLVLRFAISTADAKLALEASRAIARL